MPCCHPSSKIKHSKIRGRTTRLGRAPQTKARRSPRVVKAPSSPWRKRRSEAQSKNRDPLQALESESWQLAGAEQNTKTQIVWDLVTAGHRWSPLVSSIDESEEHTHDLRAQPGEVMGGKVENPSETRLFGTRANKFFQRRQTVMARQSCVVMFGGDNLAS